MMFLVLLIVIFLSAVSSVKLYYTQSSCASSLFISAFTAGVKLECEQVDLKTKRTASGGDYLAINPKGNVPCLVLDDGNKLLETAAAIQYIADQKPGSVCPVLGSVDRYLVMDALSFIGTEMHPSMAAFFFISDETSRIQALEKVHKKLVIVESRLAGGKKSITGVGDEPNIADFYLFNVLAWSKRVNVPIDAYPNVAAFYEYMSNLDNVKAAQARMATNPTTTVASGTCGGRGTNIAL